MKPFMKQTLAIALLAGSALSIAPAIAQAQTDNQGGSGTAAPVLPRQGSSGSQTSPETTAPAQQPSEGASTQQPSGSSADDGADSAQNQDSGQRPQQNNDSAAQTAPADSMNAQTDDARQPRNNDTAQGSSDQSDDAGKSTAATDDAQSGNAPTDDTARQNNDAEQQDSDQAATSAPSNETTGSINISTEQKTEIRSILVESDVEPVDVDVDVSVGVAIPTTVELHPLPPRIVEIVPAYRGYEYFVLADGRIIIVEPATHEVVYILVG